MSMILPVIGVGSSERTPRLPANPSGSVQELTGTVQVRVITIAPVQSG
jgi:hypothetical protein